ncbi:hypothetical protein [Arthrobacter sp. UYEF20]
MILDFILAVLEVVMEAVSGLLRHRKRGAKPRQQRRVGKDSADQD